LIFIFVYFGSIPNLKYSEFIINSKIFNVSDFIDNAILNVIFVNDLLIIVIVLSVTYNLLYTII